MAKLYEGTLEEITARYSKELNGRRLMVTIPEPVSGSEERPFHETATTEEWVHEWRAWAASHRRNIPLLSNDAVERESIYEGRGE